MAAVRNTVTRFLANNLRPVLFSHSRLASPPLITSRRNYASEGNGDMASSDSRIKKAILNCSRTYPKGLNPGRAIQEIQKCMALSST
jgi:succinate dehydrogenase/fumarate reductase-like Fe-S protein